MGNQLTLYDTNTPFDDFESSLSLQQIAMLKTVQKLIETIIVGGNQEGVYEDSMYFDDPEGQRRNSLSLVINRGLTNMFGPLTDPSLPGQRYSILSNSIFVHNNFSQIVVHIPLGFQTFKNSMMIR